jgi:RNA polymerase sigma factor (sigma-70 family)
MTGDAELLRQYTRTGSESAFEELVQRHLPLVYSAALRQVRGDEALAKDVAQTVFIDLAKKARSLANRELLAGWLYSSTRLAASNAVRTESRRRHREGIAMAMQEDPSTNPSDRERAELKLVLDEAMNELEPQDRNAVLLRFFDGKGLKEVGSALGISEDAARMRVNRSLGKLHSLLSARGVSLPAAALGTFLACEAVTAVPAGLAATIANAALANAAGGAGITLTLTKILTMTKVKLGIIGALVVAGVATPVAIQHQSQAKLREQDGILRQQNEQLSRLAAENERLSNLVTQAGPGQPLPAEPLNELLKLRAEVRRLRNEAPSSTQRPTGTGDASDKFSRLQQWMAQMPGRSIPEMRSLGEGRLRRLLDGFTNNPIETEEQARRALSNLRHVAKDDFSPQIGRALRQYAQANNDQLPTDVSQLKPYVEPPVDDAVFQRYHMLKSGSVKDLQPNEPVVAESAPVDDQYDDLFQIGLNSNTSQGTGQLTGQSSHGTWTDEDPTLALQQQFLQQVTASVEQLHQQAQQRADEWNRAHPDSPMSAPTNATPRVILIHQ